MYDWKDEIRQANERIESAITSIETAKASTYLGYEESETLDAVLLHLQDSVSLTTHLL